MIAWRGLPWPIVGDDGPEMTSRAALRWANRRRVRWRCIARGKSRRDAFESSIGRVRDELLNEQVFDGLRAMPAGGRGGRAAP